MPVAQLNPAKDTTFTVHDLFGDQGDVIGKYESKQSLELLVPHSGVRMVKLIPDK